MLGQLFAGIWYYFMAVLIKFTVFRRVRLLGNPLPGRKRPVLYVGFHKNGAVDGWAYTIALARRLTFLIHAGLVKNPLAKLFFSGIEIPEKEAESAGASNRKGLDLAISRLAKGRSLFIFPEGTSTLGPRHLEFMKGAAFVASRAAKERDDLYIIPLAIHYATPELLGGDVEVVAGRTVVPSRYATGGHHPDAKLIHRAVTEEMDALAPDFDSEQQLADASKISSLVSETLNIPYSNALYASAAILDSPVGECWRAYQEHSRTCRKWRGVAVFPEATVFSEGFFAVLSGIVILSAGVFNLLPLLAGYLAGRGSSHARNTILLRKVLAGTSVFLACTPVLWGVLIHLNQGLYILLHVCLSIVGCKCLDSWRKSCVSMWNWLFHRNLSGEFYDVKQTLCDDVMARLESM